MIVTTGHSEYKLNSGWKITLMCMAYGSPRPWMRWYKDGHLDQDINESVIGNHAIKSTLEIQKSSIDTSYGYQETYECLAGNNKADFDNKIFTVKL